MWLLKCSPSRENYLFVCSCVKCVSQTDELDVTSEEEEEDEGEGEGETEGDEVEDEMTDVWWRTFLLLLSCCLLFPFPTPRCKQQLKPGRINNLPRCGKILSVCFTCCWFCFSDQPQDSRGCEELRFLYSSPNVHMQFATAWMEKYIIRFSTMMKPISVWWSVSAFLFNCTTYMEFCYIFHVQNHIPNAAPPHSDPSWSNLC